MARSQIGCAFLAASVLSGCTVISGVGDYKVVESTSATDGGATDGGDPQADARAMKDVRDLNYTFTGMVPHAGIPLDIAIVDEGELLQARARVILPPVSDKYPAEEVVMHNALTPGKQKLYFFADNDGDGSVDGSARQILEHIWIEPVPPNGIGAFAHNTNFIYFKDDAYTSLNGALVLEMPSPTGVPLADLMECLEKNLGKRLDIKLTLIEADRQVGLFRRYRDTPAPGKVIELKGLLDGGSLYRIEVLVDGEVKKSLKKQAPPTGDLVVKAAEWFPVRVTGPADCR